MEDMDDVSKMKVADLKKYLKTKGLSVAGNKTELVERLQQALQSEENPSALEASGGVDDEEFDEEEILGGEEELDDSKITQEEEAAALAGNIKVKDDALLMAETQPEKKKISLKRSEPSLSSTTTTTEAEPTTTQEETVTSNSNSSTNLNNDKENSIASIQEPKHKIIKLSGTTSENALEARAKKFGNVANTESEETRKLARASRFGIDTSISSSTPNKKGSAKLSMEVGDTSLEVLKKRAERFGIVTSKSLSKVEEIEKKKLRQNRFASADSDKSEKSEKSEGETKKTQNGTKTPVTAPSNEDEAKKKRAERFAAAAAE